jgi:predicted glutamine amidotransferase
MCKLFFSYNYPNTKKLLRDFLAQGNAEHLEYGYGLAWQQNHDWKTYKCNCFHVTDPNSKKILADLDSSVVLGHIRNIYHENMTPKQLCDEIRIENTHPFEYKDNIFIHHGDLFLYYNKDLKNYQLGHGDKPFNKAIKTVRSHILPEFRKQIKGTTDSEILFYLLLSLQKTFMDKQNMDKKLACISSVYALSTVLDSVGISNSSNIIFSNSEYTFVAKIYKNNSDMKLKNPDFYISEKNNALLFSTYKLKSTMKVVNKNTLYVIPLNNTLDKNTEIYNI